VEGALDPGTESVGALAVAPAPGVAADAEGFLRSLRYLIARSLLELAAVAGLPFAAALCSHGRRCADRSRAARRHSSAKPSTQERPTGRFGDC